MMVGELTDGLIPSFGLRLKEKHVIFPPCLQPHRRNVRTTKFLSITRKTKDISGVTGIVLGPSDCSAQVMATHKTVPQSSLTVTSVCQQWALISYLLNFHVRLFGSCSLFANMEMHHTGLVPEGDERKAPKGSSVVSSLQSV